MLLYGSSCSVSTFLLVPCFFSTALYKSFYVVDDVPSFTPRDYTARHSSDGSNNGRSMCALWVERFIDPGEKGGERERESKMGKIPLDGTAPVVCFFPP